MKKNEQQLVLSIIALVLTSLGLIFLTTTAMVSNYNDSDNFFRIFFNGNTKTKIGGSFTLEVSDPDFPQAFTILTLIGSISMVVGALYWVLHSLSSRKKCLFTNYLIPGPIVGILFGFGGLIAFIGSMVFLPYGNDATQGSSSYAFGYIVTATLFGLFLLIGIFVILTLKKTRRSKKRRR